MTLAVLALAAQVTLAPCPIEGVPGEPRCGTHRVWEDRETQQGRQIDLSVIVLPATGPNRRPDPFFMLSGGPGDTPSFNARFFSRALGYQQINPCIGQMIGAFLDRGSAEGLDRTCAAANPAPPFLLSGPGK